MVGLGKRVEKGFSNESGGGAVEPIMLGEAGMGSFLLKAQGGSLG